MRAHEGPGRTGSPTPGGFSVSTVLEVADGLRRLDPHLSAELARHAVRLAGEDDLLRGVAEGLTTRALGELDRGAEVVERAVPLLRAALEQGRADDAAVLRCELAGAALQCRLADLAGALLAPLREAEALPVDLRPEVALRVAQVHAADGDLARTDGAVRWAHAASGAVGPLLEIDLQQARATARSVRGDAATAASILASVAGDHLGSTGLDGGRRGTTIAADHVVALLDAGAVESAHDRAAPFLPARSTAPTALALGRLRVAVAGRVHLPGAPDAAEALARSAQRDLLACGHHREAAAAGRVLADSAEARGDLQGALAALRLAHAHDLRAHDQDRRVERLLAEVVEFAGRRTPTATRDTASVALLPGPGSGDDRENSARGPDRTPPTEHPPEPTARADDAAPVDTRPETLADDPPGARTGAETAAASDPVDAGHDVVAEHPAPPEGRRGHRRREDTFAAPVPGHDGVLPRHGRDVGVRVDARHESTVDAFSTAPAGAQRSHARPEPAAADPGPGPGPALEPDLGRGQRNGARGAPPDPTGSGPPTDRHPRTAVPDTDQVVIAGAGAPASPSYGTGAGDEVDDLPLTLAGLLAEYDLPDVRAPAPSAAHGGAGPPRWATLGDGQAAGIPDGPATAGPSADDRAMRDQQEGPDSGVRLADLLADAMDAFRGCAPGAPEATAASTRRWPQDTATRAK